MTNHRLLRVAALMVVAMALPSAAQAKAKTHAPPLKISGVVTAVHAAKHTITVRESGKSAKKGKSNELTLDVGGAKIGGTNGTVAVGDKVDVTATAAGAHATNPVASDVVVSGGPVTSGAGAFFTGKATSVDPIAGTLSVTVGKDKVVSVVVDSSTTFVGADVNGDGVVNLDDVAVGDPLVVFTADSAATPVLASGVLDNAHRGSGGGA